MSDEIKAINKRNITVKLSDADCESIARMCGEHGLTVGELVENFISDLIDGANSNGSDERMYAKQWFERCGGGIFQENTLLNHLICSGYAPEDYLEASDSLEGLEGDLQHCRKKPELFRAKEETYIQQEIADCEERLREMKEDWNIGEVPDMEAERQMIMKWKKDKDMLTDGISIVAGRIMLTLWSDPVLNLDKNNSNLMIRIKEDIEKELII